jgi:two-component system LytT family response regulator
VGQKQRLASLVSQFTGDDCEDILRRLANGESLESQRYPDHLSIKDGGEVTVLKTRMISWIDAAGDYMCVHTAAENYILRITMKKLTSQLDERIFQRIHKSTIVNINRVKSIQSLRNNESILDLGNDIKLKVSRNYNFAIKAIIENRA